MKLRVRNLNKNEMFCCSIKEVKDVFKDCDVSVWFFHRSYCSDTIYLEPKMEGKVIAHFGITHTSGGIGTRDHTPVAILNFYVLKKYEMSSELHQEFVEKILPKIYEGYRKHQNCNPEGIDGSYFFKVSLTNEKLLFREGIATWNKRRNNN